MRNEDLDRVERRLRNPTAAFDEIQSIALVLLDELREKRAEALTLRDHVTKARAYFAESRGER